MGARMVRRRTCSAAVSKLSRASSRSMRDSMALDSGITRLSNRLRAPLASYSRRSSRALDRFISSSSSRAYSWARGCPALTVSPSAAFRSTMWLETWALTSTLR